MLPLFADAAPPPGQNLLDSIGTQNLMLYGAIAVGILLLLVILIFLMSRGKKRVNPESGLDEDLSEYPPAQGKPGPRRLTIHGRPVRLRLVVVAPVGKRTIAEGGAVEALLDEVLRGLGKIAQQDKPRIKIWPPQLSQQGFAPTFFRKTHCPDRAGKLSHWLLAAGPSRAGGKPVLLGLAMWADDKGPMEQIILTEMEWDDALQIKTV
jgi:hypothetical protein